MTWAIFPDDKYSRALIELLTAGSERVVAVVGGTLLEDAVDRTLRERLLNDTQQVDSLLLPDESLGNLGPKITLLYLLGAFDKETRSAIKGIARVRNFFAHNLDASFDSTDKKFKTHITRLKLHENRTHYPHHLFGPDSDIAIDPVTSNRDKFVVNLKLALIALMRDRVSRHPYSNQPFSKNELLEKYPNRYSARN